MSKPKDVSPSKYLVVVCTPEEDKTRQEFLKECSVSYQLAKFGYGRPLQFAEVDYNMDLLSARTVLADVASSFSRLPESIRSKYSDWAAVIAAIEDGSLTLDKAPAQVEDSPRPKAGADDSSGAEDS